MIIVIWFIFVFPMFLDIATWPAGLLFTALALAWSRITGRGAPGGTDGIR